MKTWRVTYRIRHQNGKDIDYDEEIQAETLQTAFVLGMRHIVEPTVKFPEVYDCVLTGITLKKEQQEKRIRNPITRMISENLKRLAAENRATPEDVADGIGYRREVVARYFDGSKQPKVYAIYKMAKYFGVTMEDILIGMEEACSE